MSFMFIEAATSIPTEDITEENMRRYTLERYKIDITQHMNNQKTLTRSAVAKESKQIPPISALRRKTAKEESGAGASKDQSQADIPPTSEGVAESTAAIPKKNSRKTEAANSKAAEAETDFENSCPVQTAKSDELLGKSPEKTDGTKEMLKTAAKKEPKATKVKAKATVKREKSKLKGTTKVAAKEESSKWKRRARSSAKKETPKPKRTKAVAEKDKKK